MAFPILGTPKPQFFDSSGAPLSGGTVTIVEPSTDVQKATYPTYDDAEAATNPNDNPITLDARGECDLWGLDNEDYKVTVKDPNGAVIWTTDDIFMPTATTYYRITAAETAAGVTISDYSYAPGNVLRYGAVGDGGTTNNFQALQDALNVSYVHSMYIPKGTDFYSYSGALVMPDQPNVTIRGEYGGSEIRQATAATDGIKSNANGTRRGVLIEDIAIGVDGATTQGGVALNLSNITDSRFKNVAVIADNANQGFLTGIRVYTPTGGGAYRNEFLNCQVRTDDDAAAVGVLYGGDTDESSNSNHWVGGQIQAGSGIGVNITDNGTEVSNQNTFINVSFEGSTATAVNLAGASHNVVAFCRFEGPTTGIALDTNCSDNVFMFNLASSGVTLFSKAGNSVQENLFLDMNSSGGRSRIMELGGGHYKVSALQDTSRAGFDSEMATAAWPAFGTRVTGDTNMRLEARVDGQMEWGPGDAASDVGLRRQSGGVLQVILGTLDVQGVWNGVHLVMGSYHLWVDATGDLRIKSGAPASDTDGTVVGAQS